MTTDKRDDELDSDARERSNRQASTSMESPSNVPRSTQGLTVGGTEKAPDIEKPTSSPEPKKAAPSSVPGGQEQPAQG